MKRLVLFTLLALAPSYVFTHGSEQPPPVQPPSVSPPVTYVITPFLPGPSQQDVSGAWGFA